MISVMNGFSSLPRGVTAAIVGLLCLGGPGVAQTHRDLSVERIPDGRRIALVIGNANYPGHKLINPVHDADDMKAALERVGFTVNLGKDLSKRAMQDQVAKFLGDLREGDVALFYYSGHGMEIDGENLLVPTDFPSAMPPPNEAKAASFPLEDVQRSLEKSKARLSILVMDACRTNPYRRVTRAWDQGMAPVDAALGAYIAFAASPGQTADDNSGERNGLFTKFLLHELGAPPPLSQVFREVRDNVYEASGKVQRPYLVDQVTGDFNFRSLAQTAPAATAPPPEAAPAPQAPMEEGLRLYREGNCEAALKLFDRAIRESPQDPFAQNATGVAYVCLKQYSLAIPRFDMAIRLRPSFAEAYMNRGAAYSTEGQYDLAVENFDWAVEAEPWNPVFFTRRGQANFQLRKYEEALKDFNRGIELNPGGADAFYGRGQVRERQGHYAEAADDFAAALERNSTLTAARQDLDRLKKRLSIR
jgi:tetratricopeptide (TPR) repeat protein